MIEELELPSVDETQLKVTIGDKSTVFDIWDIQEVARESYKKASSEGYPDQYMSFFIKNFNTKYKIQLTMMTATALLDKVNAMEDALKKKFSHLQGLYVSTDSTPVSQPVLSGSSDQ